MQNNKKYNTLQELVAQYLLNKITLNEIQQIVETQMQQEFQNAYNKAKHLSETTATTFQEALDKEIEALKSENY